MHRPTNDIKAPDGYTLGGLRLVRGDGTILFNRGWWQAPKDWVGEKVWVHEADEGRSYTVLEAAHPGLHIYEARTLRPPHTIICERTDRPDAKPAYRLPHHKAWAKLRAQSSDYETCHACGGETHIQEAACIHCGTTKAVAA